MSRPKIDYYVLLKALDNAKGTLLICDKDKNVIFYNKVVQEALCIPENQLDSTNLNALEQKGYILNSSSLQVYETKKTCVKYVQGKMPVPILTVSNPVLDENGDIDMVIAMSFDENTINIINQEIFKTSEKNKQLISFLSSRITKKDLIIAESPLTKKIVTFINRVAPSDSTILLTGETGVGKEVFAKYIHTHSKRCSQPFIPVNCAAIPETLIESELFGYEKGAFTGAKSTGKAGMFELADKGTIFLDEIGDMPLTTQTKLLRVIETSEITRLGAEKSTKVDFRLIAATNKDLKAMCNEGLFRSDLFYRLSILPIEIPPLRERKEDIKPLTEAFLKKLNKKYNTSKAICPSVINKMENYYWPGNIRELKNVVERMFITEPDTLITLEENDNLFNTINSSSYNPQASSIETDYENLSLHEALDNYEYKLIMETLNSCGGNVARAAEKLKMHKSALYRKLDKYRNQAVKY